MENANGFEKISRCYPKKKKFAYSINFDNLFTSFPLMKNLQVDGLDSTGTIRENRCKKY